MAGDSPTFVPTRLKLPEIVELLVTHFESTKEHARSHLERAVYDGSLRDIKTLYPDGMEIETEIRAWQEIDWDEGIVMIEPSWAGSPPEMLPVYPMFGREEVCNHFHIDVDQKRTANRRRGGRPAQYDWDAFWIEVCRRLYENGPPKTQSQLVDEMLNWFIDRGDENIDQRTIQKKIAKLLKVLSIEK